MSRNFLARWSRLKQAAAAATPAGEPLDPEKLLANLGPDSDFGQFLREEISEEIRRKAMKTLFADPQFNVIDEMDIYIDDYSIFEPIPDEMMATLQQAKTLFAEPESPAAPEITQAEDPSSEPDSAPAPCDILSSEEQIVPASENCKLPETKNQ